MRRMVLSSRPAPGAPGLRRVAGLLGAVAVAAIRFGEVRHPLRRQTAPALPRIARNLAMGALCAAVVAAVETPAARVVARGNVRHRRGLAHRVPVPLRGVAAFLAMDYGFYLWHVATHRVPLLWRLHRVHHVDPDMDMSTAIRFHLVDMLVSLPWRLVQVRASGISPGTLDAWQRFFTLSILFHHSNWALPPGWDRRLSWLLTTPRMHGIHHSVLPAERHSNWSSGISLWDRLHGSFRATPPPRAVRIGVDDPRARADVALPAALLAPFRRTPADRHARSIRGDRRAAAATSAASSAHQAAASHSPCSPSRGDSSAPITEPAAGDSHISR